MSRVEELLGSMAWDEKLAQMQIVFRPDPAELDWWVRAGVGATFWPRSAAAVNALQRVAVEQTRLGIPLLIGLELGPQFDFGHGGGYTAFRHADARLSAGFLPLAALESGEQVEVSVDVTNTGGRDGDEVIQLYLQDLVSSAAQPVRRLVAFARRHVGARQTITISFKLGPEQLGFWDAEANPARFVVEPGTFGLYIGGSLRATQELTFEVV